MAYFVLARRWRPQGFEAVIGQAHVTRTLTNELRSGRIGHAFLFSGSRGVGKTTTARILAKALNCEKGPTPEPCGQCESCQAIAAGSAVDVVEIDGASNRGIDEIRELRENVRYAPVSGRFKIFIIDEVHMLTKEAFNALLKTLEEPPERVKFILATTESHKVPATIRSRCQHFDFRLVPTEVLMKTLEGIVRSENLQVSPRSLRLIAQAGRGSVRDALSLMEQVLAFTGAEAAEEDVASVLGLARLEVFHSFLEGIHAQDVDLLLRTTERLLESGYDLYQITQNFLDYLRDLCVLRAVPMPGGLLDRAAEEIPRMQGVAQRFELDTLMRYFQMVQQTSERMRLATHPRPLFEMLLIGLTRVRNLQPIEELVRRLTDLEARLGGEEPPQRSRGPAPDAPSSGGQSGSSWRGREAERPGFNRSAPGGFGSGPKAEEQQAEMASTRQEAVEASSQTLAEPAEASQSTAPSAAEQQGLPSTAAPTSAAPKPTPQAPGLQENNPHQPPMQVAVEPAITRPVPSAGISPRPDDAVARAVTAAAAAPQAADPVAPPRVAEPMSPISDAQPRTAALVQTPAARPAALASEPGQRPTESSTRPRVAESAATPQSPRPRFEIPDVVLNATDELPEIKLAPAKPVFKDESARPRFEIPDVVRNASEEMPEVKVAASRPVFRDDSAKPRFEIPDVVLNAGDEIPAARTAPTRSSLKPEPAKPRFEMPNFPEGQEAPRPQPQPTRSSLKPDVPMFKLPQAFYRADEDFDATEAAGPGPSARPEPARREVKQGPLPLRPLTPEEESGLEVLARVCANLDGKSVPKLLINALRSAGLGQLGAETVLLLRPGDLINSRQLEEARQKSQLEEALAAELQLPKVQIRIERSQELPANLLLREALERRKQEKVWIQMARALDGVRRALQMFGGRIESIEIEEEDGERTTILVEDEPQPESVADVGR